MMGFFRFVQRVLLAVVFLSVTTVGCLSEPSQSTANGECADNNDCGPGQFCSDGACYKICGDTTDCPANSTCKELLCIPAQCGDGLIEGLEECDEKSNNSNSSTCTEECKNAVCGDGLLWDGMETCDDGNDVDGDGCDSNCTLTACGNGIVTSGEACDDGNNIDSDGCEADCQFTECGDSVPDGTLCQSDGAFCNGVEICQGGLCVSPGSPCQEDSFDCTAISCDENIGECVTSVSTGMCFIGSECFLDNAVNGANACEFCDSYLDQFQWQSWGGDLVYSDAPYPDDEGKSLLDSCGVGACDGGFVVCDNQTQTLQCSTAVQISEEDSYEQFDSALCNGIDDDCDGVVDENYFWDFSNFVGAEFDYYGDYANDWFDDLPLQEIYFAEDDPNQRKGTAYGRNLPQGDYDHFRIKVNEADTSVGTRDKRFHVRLIVSAPLNYSIWFEACWSSRDEQCKYNGYSSEYLIVSEGTSQLLELTVDEGTMSFGEADVAYLDLSVEPYLEFSDYGCDEYEISWDIIEQ